MSRIVLRAFAVEFPFPMIPGTAVIDKWSGRSSPSDVVSQGRVRPAFSLSITA